MRIDEYARLVRDMRNGDELVKARQFEAAVDVATAEMLDGQQSLFCDHDPGGSKP